MIFVSDRIELHYTTYSRGIVPKSKKNKLKDYDILLGKKSRNERVKEVELGLEVLQSGLRYMEGGTVVEDNRFDSNYMLNIMPKVGGNIWDAYFGVQENEPIYLVLDIAGSHGTKEDIYQYKECLDRV